MQGTTVAITGASQGLGLAIAKAAAARGAEVALIDHNAAALAQAHEQLGASATAFPCDVRDAAAVDVLAAALADWRPRLDVVINNAGVWTDNKLDAADPGRRTLAFETNAVGTIAVTEALLPQLLRQKSGHVFNVISVAGDGLSPASDNRLWRTYGATKWAVAGYTKALRESLGDTGVRVTGFFPGGIDTNLYENAGLREGIHDQPWMMRAEDVADVVIFMLTRPPDMTVESLTLTKHQA